MFVYFGPYRRYYGVYTLVDPLRFLGVGEDRRQSIAVWLEKTWVAKTLRYFSEHRKDRLSFVRISRQDIWSMDDTLAKIILPMLKKLKEIQIAAPEVFESDVPSEVWSAIRTQDKTIEEIDVEQLNIEEKALETMTYRWNWVMSEMIWAFEQLNTDWESEFYQDNEFKFEEYKKKKVRIERGLQLFGKYYLHLWD
jgi:hypothetical protein